MGKSTKRKTARRGSSSTEGSRSFEPSSIAMRLQAAVRRDLEGLQHAYIRPSVESAFFQSYQNESLLKKFTSDSPLDKDLRVKLTFEKFLRVNEHMSHFSFPDISGRMSTLCQLGRILKRMRFYCHQVLGELVEDEWFHACRHGSGSSIGVPYIDTSLERKFTPPFSGTLDANRLFVRYLSYNHRLSRYLGEIPEYLQVTGSRATTVPKTDKIDRMIAIEPTLNMFFQQGLMSLMYERFKKAGFGLRALQPEHTRLAYESSITGSNATIDFSSASDCVSTLLLEKILPPQWFHSLNLVRCKEMVFPDGTSIPLNMFSTMGNATTFPLETLVLRSLAISVLVEKSANTNRIFPTDREISSISVFGDDCIVPTDSCHLFIEMAKSIGFLVNEDKTFLTPEGGFRESCGGDYLHGKDVRPLFIKAPHNNRLSSLEPWLYSIMNGLQQKYISYFGPLNYLYDKEFYKEMRLIFKEFKLAIRLVPPYYPDDSGLHACGDHWRLLRTYRFPRKRILVDRHGTAKFGYLRFVYRESVKWNEDLRYLERLRSLSRSSGYPDALDLPHVYFRRRIGGYVVASGYSGHWPELGIHPLQTTKRG